MTKSFEIFEKINGDMVIRLENLKMYFSRFCKCMEYHIEKENCNFDDVVKKCLIDSDLHNNILNPKNPLDDINYSIFLNQVFKKWKYGCELEKWFFKQYEYKNSKKSNNPFEVTKFKTKRLLS